MVNILATTNSNYTNSEFSSFNHQNSNFGSPSGNTMNRKLLDKWYLGSREVYFEKPIESRFICRLCESIMDNPIQTERGFISCKKCYFEKREDLGDLCPLDGEKIENVSTFTRLDRFTQREIAKIKVKCFHKDCSWIGALDDINNHENTDCEFAKTECNLCSKEILIKDLKTHQAENCGLVSEPHSYDFENSNECPYGCDVTVDPENLTEHVSYCEALKSLNRCPYHFLGCTSIDSSQSVSEHVQSNHNDVFMLCYVRKLMKQNEELREEQEQNNKTISKQRGIVDSLQKELAEEKVKLKKLETNFEQKKQEVKYMKDNVSGMIIQFNKMKSIDYNEKVTSLLECQRQIGPASSPNIQELQKLSNSTDSIKGLEKEQALLSANLADAELKMQLLEHLSTDGRQLWRIDNFRYRLNQAMNGKIVALHSAPCYTDPNGYKFCIRVYPNGDGMGRGTHLSIYFVLMKNHYDDLLQWPFQRKVTFRLLNFRDITKSKKETFITDKTSSSFQKPVRDMNIAAGCPKFLHKDILQNEGFLVDDSIYVETIVEKVQ